MWKREELFSQTFQVPFRLAALNWRQGVWLYPIEFSGRFRFSGNDAIVRIGSGLLMLARNWPATPIESNRPLDHCLVCCFSTPLLFLKEGKPIAGRSTLLPSRVNDYPWPGTSGPVPRVITLVGAFRRRRK
jgi:hypothetical protein